MQSKMKAGDIDNLNQIHELLDDLLKGKSDHVKRGWVLRDLQASLTVILEEHKKLRALL
jgi:hypothetical protein